MNRSTKLSFVFMYVLCLVILLLISGCSLNKASEVSYPYKMQFNVVEVFSKTVGDDPYAVFTFDVSTLDRKLSSEIVKVGDIIFVKFYDSDGVAVPLSYSSARPTRGIFVEARVAYVYSNSILVTYSFDTLKLPKTTSREPESIAGVSVKISTNGTAVTDTLLYKINQPI